MGHVRVRGAQRQLKLSSDVNECKPLPAVHHDGADPLSGQVLGRVWLELVVLQLQAEVAQVEIESKT
jgi:hypothetical protein